MLSRIFTYVQWITFTIKLCRGTVGYKIKLVFFVGADFCQTRLVEDGEYFIADFLETRLLLGFVEGDAKVGDKFVAGCVEQIIDG